MAVWLPLLSGGWSSPLDGLGPDDWADAARFAIRHRLGPLLLHRLTAAGRLDVLPLPGRESLERQRARIVRESLARQRSFVLAAQALHDAGLPVVPFKGIALAFGVYPDPVCRPMADVDLWVPAARASEAAAAMRSLGLRYDEKRERPLAWQLARDGEIRFTRPEDGHRLIELHVGFFAGEWLRWAARIDRGGVEARFVSGRILGQPVALLAPEDAILQVALHASVNEQLAGPIVRQCLDLALLSQAGLDWGEVVARARDWRVSRAVGVAFAVANALFPGTGLGDAARSLRGRSRVGPGARFVPSVAELLAGRSLRAEPVTRVAYLLRLVG